MPTKRTVRAHRSGVLSPLEIEHLGSGGDHLLAGGPECCRLCRDGISEGDWLAGRDAVLRDWHRLQFPFPPLGAILFDAERLPPIDPGWRDLHRWTWTMIVDQFAALDVQRIVRDA